MVRVVMYVEEAVAVELAALAARERRSLSAAAALLLEAALKSLNEGGDDE